VARSASGARGVTATLPDPAADAIAPATPAGGLPSRLRWNALSNYAYTAVSVVLALVMTPVLVHGLGKERYGLWTLIGSLVVYLEAFNLGFGTATMRFVGEFWTLGQKERARRAVATAVHILAVPGLIALIVGGVLALSVTHLFQIPGGNEGAAAILMLIVSIDLALSIPFDVFGGVLIARQRFELLNATLIAVALLQAAGWVIVLALDGGLVALGITTVALSLTAQVVRYFMARRLLGGLSLSPRLFDRSLVRPMGSMSAWVAVAEVMLIVIQRMDVVVVAAVVSVPAAGVYAVGAKLAQLATQAVLPMANTFFPHATALHARRDHVGLARLINTGTRLLVTLALPALILLVFLAPQAIEVWVGPGFGDAALVTMLLAATTVVMSLTHAGTFALRGAGDVRPPALMMTAEAGLNLSLSIVLGLTMGLAGVALATLIAASVVHVLFLLPYICRRFGVSYVRLTGSLARAQLLPCAAAAGVGWYLHSKSEDSVGLLFGAGLLVLGAYGLTFVATGLTRAERSRLWERVRRSRTRPTRVLIVDPSDKGGIPAYVDALARGLVACGAEPVVLGSRALPHAGQPYRTLRWIPVSPWWRPENAGAGFYVGRALAWLTSASQTLLAVLIVRPDVVHFQFGLNRRFDPLLLRVLRRFTRIVWTAHDVLPFEEGERGAVWFTPIYRLVNAVVVHTEPARRGIRELSGRGAHIVRHAVASDIEPIPRAAARARLGLPESGRVLVAAGFIRPYKGYDLLAEVWERLGEDAPYLLVVGEPSESELDVVRRLDACPRTDVRATYASVDDLRAAVAAADALLLPYVEASDSGVLHLARVLGTPVIASDAPQLAWAVAESGAGIVVPRNAEDWADAVRGPLPPTPPPPHSLEEVGRDHVAVYDAARARPQPRVLMYTDATERGGAEQALGTLIATLDGAIDVTVAGVDTDLVQWLAAQRPGTPAVVVPAVANKRDLRPIVAHWRAVRAARPDVFHANLRHPWSCQYGLLAAALRPRTRIVAVEHALTEAASPLQRRLRRALGGWIDYEVSVAERAARTIEELVGYQPGHVRVIPNPVPDRAAAPAERVSEGPVVGVVARLSPEKGVDVLVRALPELPDVTVAVVGDGPERAALAELAAELGVTDPAGATTFPRSSGRSTCSRSPPAAKGPRSWPWRRCSARSPSSPAPSAACPRSCSTARTGCSCRRMIPTRSPSPSGACSTTPSYAPGSGGRAASSLSAGTALLRPPEHSRPSTVSCSMPEPHALVLTHTPPLPLVSGERIRNFHLLRELRQRGWRVSLFAVDADGRTTTDADRERLAELCETVRIEPIHPSRRARLTSLLLGRPIYEKFFYDAGAHASFLELLREPYDAIVVEALYMSAYVPADARDRMLLDAHNAELPRIESMARVLGGKPRGIAARLQRAPLRRYEREVAASAAAVTCVSEADAAYFERLAPGRVSVVPNGVDTTAFTPRQSCPSEPSVLFVGSMDYNPNLDAVGYLAREILPALGRDDVSVTVIGSNPRKEAYAHARRSSVPIEILGYVEDTTPYFERSRVFAVPLRFGGGTRLKILEALARGIPVVSTSLGCEGLDLEPGRDLLVADGAAEFARCLDRLLSDDGLCRALAEQGRATVQKRYDWRGIGERFDGAARGVLRAADYDPAVSGGGR
jgi:glycosyltransferase involved in cell wall biosynthesis/O-antigen/teichoic acid export membrane protein